MVNLSVNFPHCHLVLKSSAYPKIHYECHSMPPSGCSSEEFEIAVPTAAVIFIMDSMPPFSFVRPSIAQEAAIYVNFKSLPMSGKAIPAHPITFLNHLKSFFTHFSSFKLFQHLAGRHFYDHQASVVHTFWLQGAVITAESSIISSFPVYVIKHPDSLTSHLFHSL